MTSISANIRVTDVGVADLAKLPKLEHLMLFGELVTDESLVHIARMPALKTLWFQRCRVSDQGLQLIRNSKTIEYLLIHETDMTSAGLEHLSTLKNLKILDLDLFPTSEPKENWQLLERFTNLEELRLEGMAFQNADMIHLRKLQQLKGLNLKMDRDYPLNDTGIAHLAALHALERIRIKSSEVTDKGIQALAGMKNLEFLTFPSLTTDEGLDHLKGLTSLRYLQIASPNITKEGVKKLEQSLPSLQTVNHFEYRR